MTRRFWRRVVRPRSNLAPKALAQRRDSGQYEFGNWISPREGDYGDARSVLKFWARCGSGDRDPTIIWISPPDSGNGGSLCGVNRTLDAGLSWREINLGVFARASEIPHFMKISNINAVCDKFESLLRTNKIKWLYNKYVGGALGSRHAATLPPPAEICAKANQAPDPPAIPGPQSQGVGGADHVPRFGLSALDANNFRATRLASQTPFPNIGRGEVFAAIFARGVDRSRRRMAS